MAETPDHMTKLEQLYNSIQNLKELGVHLPDKLIEETNRVEKEIIQKEVIPALSNAIEPIISQIKRELFLVVEYIPDEPLQVRMIRKLSIKSTEEGQQLSSKREDQIDILLSHTKAKRKNLIVSFPDGTEISNQYAYQTLLETIEKAGPEKVMSLGIRINGIDLISKTEDDFYQQHKINGGHFVVTHSSTEAKKNQIEEISTRLSLNLKVKKD